jgi:ATP-dependent Lhr-like helicase
MREVLAQQLHALPGAAEDVTLPQAFTVLAGRQEVGRTDPMLLTEKTDGPRLLLLGGRSWKVTWTD